MSADLVVTAASAEHSVSLLALLGSLKLNWPGHPRVLVYDLGLDRETLAILEKHGTCVRKVPAFCPHWRHHHTWRFWCLNDAPGRDVIWIDARVVVMQALDEVCHEIRRNGYFATTNDERLDAEASPEAWEGCSMPGEFRPGKLAVATALVGFRKAGTVRAVLAEALEVARVERYIAARSIFYRPDQTILSLLLYKHLGNIALSDSSLYACTLSPSQTPGQKVWVHRDKLLKADADYLRTQLSTAGGRYCPSPPFTLAEAQSAESVFKACRRFAHSDRTSAETHLRDALGNATFMTPMRIASLLEEYRRHMSDVPEDATGDAFIVWATTIIRKTKGWVAARRVRGGVYGLEGVRRLQTGRPEDGCLLLARSALTHPSFVVANRRELMEVVTRAASGPARDAISLEMARGGAVRRAHRGQADGTGSETRQ